MTFAQKLLLFCVPVAIGVAVALPLALYVYHKDPLPPAGLSVHATPAEEVVEAPKVPVAVQAPVKVYSGGKALKKKLKLPEVVSIDPAKEVIASSQVKADERPQTITTILNTETGESETYVRRDSLPWLAWDTGGEVGAYVGIKNGQQAVRLQARQGIVQVKGLHLGLIGSVDQAMSGATVVNGTDYFVGAGIWAKW